MELIKLKEVETSSKQNALYKTYLEYNHLLSEIKDFQLPDPIIRSINRDIEQLNYTSRSGGRKRRLIKQKINKVTKILRREVNIVPKRYHQSQWTMVGLLLLLIFIPIFIIYDISNSGLFALLIMLVALGCFFYGRSLDKKAKQEGRQLKINITL